MLACPRLAKKIPRGPPAKHAKESKEQQPSRHAEIRDKPRFPIQKDTESTTLRKSQSSIFHNLDCTFEKLVSIEADSASSAPASLFHVNSVRRSSTTEPLVLPELQL